MKNEIEIKVMEWEDNGEIDYDLSSRGGYYGMDSKKVADLLGLGEYVGYLPHKVGAYCNYLGGGIRGSIVASNYDKRLPDEYKEKVDIFTAACVQRYMELEGEAGLVDEYDLFGDTNWDNVATNATRNAGITSAY